jgi:hypothetical protein
MFARPAIARLTTFAPGKNAHYRANGVDRTCRVNWRGHCADPPRLTGPFEANNPKMKVAPEWQGLGRLRMIVALLNSPEHRGR